MDFSALVHPLRRHNCKESAMALERDTAPEDGGGKFSVEAEYVSVCGMTCPTGSTTDHGLKAHASSMSMARSKRCGRLLKPTKLDPFRLNTIWTDTDGTTH